jgi:hypothetical protein
MLRKDEGKIEAIAPLQTGLLHEKPSPRQAFAVHPNKKENDTNSTLTR